jgi:hypothetical protein
VRSAFVWRCEHSRAQTRKQGRRVSFLNQNRSCRLHQRVPRSGRSCVRLPSVPRAWHSRPMARVAALCVCCRVFCFGRIAFTDWCPLLSLCSATSRYFRGMGSRVGARAGPWTTGSRGQRRQFGRGQLGSVGGTGRRANRTERAPPAPPPPLPLFLSAPW